jgi:CubicO group peptidase (beta-lactamase class C family)
MPRLPRRQFLRAAGAVALGVIAPPVPRASASRSAARADPSPEVSGHDPVPTALRRALPSWMETARVPGLAVATLRRGHLTGVHGFGGRDAGSGDPVRADTVFEAASLSKMVTAYAALGLVQHGKLELDTPLVRYAPSPAEPDQALAGTITLRHALTHSTGFRN